MIEIASVSQAEAILSLDSRTLFLKNKSYDSLSVLVDEKFKWVYYLLAQVNP